MPTVVVPSLLRKLTSGRDRVTAQGRNIGELVADLERQFPGFAGNLVENGDIKPSVAVSIDGEMGTGGVLDRVSENSEVFFIPAISGG